MTPNIMPTGFDPNCAICMYWVDRLTPDQLANVQEVMHGEAGTHTALYRDGNEVVIDHDLTSPAPQEGIVPAREGGPVILEPLVMELTDLDDEEDEEDCETYQGTVLEAPMEQEIAERGAANGEDQDPA